MLLLAVHARYAPFMVFSSPPLGFICSPTGQTPDLLLPL